MIAIQEDAALVAAMARQAHDDADLIHIMEIAGCSREECRAVIGTHTVTYEVN